MTVTNIRSSDGHSAEVRKPIDQIQTSLLPSLRQVTGSGYNGEGDVLCGEERVTYDSHPSICKIVEVGAVCNNAEIINGQLRGQPTEGALLAVALKVTTSSIFCLFSTRFSIRLR